MMPSNTTTKPSARSRFSSPLHLSASPSSHNRGSDASGTRTFMQRWLEPPVQNKASFQEAGLMRTGVVETMAPLGTLPKAAMLKKPGMAIEGSPGPAVKRIVLKKSVARDTSVKVEESTPQPATAADWPEGDAADIGPTSPTQPIFPVNGLDDKEDEDYMPKKKPRARRSSTNNALGRPIRSGRRSSARPKSPAAASVPSPTQSRASPVRFHPPSAATAREPEDKDFADRVVESAVDEALRHYRYPTAWALRLLYDENSSDPHFVSMIEDIYFQRADIETLQEFHRLVNDKKKDGKKDNKGCYYFVPPATNTRFTPHKPKPAPYSELLTMDLTPAKGSSIDEDGHVSKKPKLMGDQDGATSHGANGANGINGNRRARSITKSPSKVRKTRSGSVSSDSSLSSVPDDVPDDFNEYMDLVDDLGIARPSAAEPNHADSAQPISARQKKPATKKKNVSPGTDPSPNTTQPSHPPQSTMPGLLVNGTNHHNAHQHSDTADSPTTLGESAESDRLSQAKLDSKAKTIGITKRQVLESFSRKPLAADSFVEDAPALAPAEQTRAVRTPALSLRAARAAKRKNEDADESSSPTAASFRADLEPSSARDSRAATPSNVRSNKKQRAGPRVKTSPMKKKGTTAGIPRGSGERPSPVGNGAPNDKDDNDDSCFSCGGNGELVCCDGCTNSFHFMCIDPPMDEGHMPDEWYCNECMHKFFPAQFTGHRGTFGSLLDNLDKKNPRAFRLPLEIREYFEGVKTGQDGEYEEIPTGKPKINKKGYDEPFDFFKVRSAEGNAVLCHQCQHGTTDNRPIIPCSVCGLNWHLECLEPPMTIPPVLRNWRCPCHADDALIGRLGPAHKYRKIKNAPVIEQAYTRGLANNGFVEVEEDDDDDEPMKSVRDSRDFGRIYRLPERGIKLDFISRVHENRGRALAQSPLPNPASAVAPRIPTIEEQQAALNLSQLANGDAGVDQLLRAMISQASPTVVSLMAQGDAQRIANGDLAESDASALRAMLAQIDALKNGIGKILEGLDPSHARSGRASQASPATTLASQGAEKPATPFVNSDDGKSSPTAMTLLTPDTNAEKGDDHDGDSAMQVD